MAKIKGKNPLKALKEIEYQISESKSIMRQLMPLLEKFEGKSSFDKNDPIAQFTFNPLSMEKMTKNLLDQLY